ncbi:MAG: HpcH/HpaI aldolase family protein [Beutenbergiaceae bacterium]
MTINLRARLAAGDTLVGTFCAIPHPAAVEMVATAGFDFLCLDAEHSAIGRSTAEAMIRAASASGVPALIRVAGNTPELIGGALDAGAAGVIVPRVNSAEEAAQAVSAARYPPLGARGAGPGRATGYGSDIPRYLATANDDLLLAVQVETTQAVTEAAQIAAVDGIDLLFIGPGDLAVSVAADRQGAADPQELSQMMSSVVAAAKNGRRHSGLFRPDATDLGHWSRAGASLFILGAESMFMMSAARAATVQAREQLAGVAGV